MDQTKLYAIILAGGIGTRFDRELPKQFSEVAGKPLIMHTLSVFYNCAAELKIILVLHSEHVEIWHEMVEHYRFSVPHTVVLGGIERFHSAKNAFNTILEDEEALVAVHDGVRPFVAQDVILRTFSEASKYGAAVPALPTVNPIRLYKDGHSKSLDQLYDRSNIHIVQTPQVFKYKILKQAFDQDYREIFRDDSMPVELTGHKIHVVPGNIENIKITFPIDLAYAEVLYPMMFMTNSLS